MQLESGTHIVGGHVCGDIIGDPDEPALLENVTVEAGTTLEHVIIGSKVTFGDNVSEGEGVQVATPSLSLERAEMEQAEPELIISPTYFMGGLHSQGVQHANGHAFSQVEAKTVRIKTQVLVESTHVGYSASLLMVGIYKTFNRTVVYVRDGEVWTEWDERPLDELQAAAQFDSLPDRIGASIFEGNLSGLPGGFTIYTAYRLKVKRTLIFNGNNPIKFSVE